MFGLPRFHRWRTLCTARLCAGGPMRIGESRRCHRQTCCLSRVSLVTAAARCRWRNVDCRRVSCNGSCSSRQHLIELMDTHGPDLLPDHVRVSATWSQTSQRGYQLCAPEVLTASARHPNTRHPLNPLLPLPAPLLDFRPRQLASTLFLNLSLRLLQMERRLLPSSRERHRAP